MITQFILTQLEGYHQFLKESLEEQYDFHGDLSFHPIKNFIPTNQSVNKLSLGYIYCLSVAQ